MRLKNFLKELQGETKELIKLVELLEKLLIKIISLVGWVFILIALFK